MKKILLLCFALMLLFTAAAQADTWKVRMDGTGDYATLTEAVANAAAGDTIDLGMGVYTADNETFPIMLEKPLTIIGQEGTVLDSPRFTTLVKIVSDDVTLENIDFQVRKWGIVSAENRGMTVRNCSFTLADVECRTSSTAIWMQGIKFADVSNCVFKGVGICVAGVPLNAQSPGKAVLTGLCEVGEDPEFFTTHRFDSNTVNGKPMYYFHDLKNVVIPSDAGSAVVAYCDGVTVEDADFSDSSMGVEIVHSSHVSMTNVTVDRCGIFGTYVAFCQDGVLDNIHVQYTNHGIDTRASDNIVIKNSLAVDCDQGIFFSKCTNCISADCSVIRCGFAYFAAVGDGQKIERCTFIDDADGIYLQNEENTTITDCSMSGNTVVGLRMLNASCTMTNTNIVNCWTGGLLFGSHNTLIENCVFDSNASANLYMADHSNVEITNCTVKGETKAHLEMERSFENTVVHNCTFSGSEETMIKHKGDQWPEIRDNIWNAAN